MTQLLLMSTFLSLPCLANDEEHALNQDLQGARSLIKAFGSDLKQALTKAMSSEGPIKALEVCNLQAGPIAKKHSLLSDWDIARTSTKVRNAKNAPDEWELAVLEQFEKRKLAGESLTTMEYFEVVQKGDNLVHRYMKPISTSGICLTCHGQNVSNEITNKVKLLYPNDQATGFQVGDIRGAFTLQKESVL